MITKYSSYKDKAEASYFAWVFMYIREVFLPDDALRADIADTLKMVASLIVYVLVILTAPVSIPILAYISMTKHRESMEDRYDRDLG